MDWTELDLANPEEKLDYTTYLVHVYHDHQGAYLISKKILTLHI